MFDIFDTIKKSHDRKSLQGALKLLVFLVIFGLVIFAVKSTDSEQKKSESGTFSITKEDKTLIMTVLKIFNAKCKRFNMKTKHL